MLGLKHGARELLSALLRSRIGRRAPDMIIGGDERPYLMRWFVIPRNRWLNLYLHLFLRSDDDRALHDHPWASCSLILDGYYLEHEIAAGGVHSRKRRDAGALIFRSAKAAHRIEIEAPCWTLFITGPKLRTWGFHCPGGWVHWRDFTNPEDGGRTIGRGCAALDAGEADAP
ncbi:hypothetical protein [Methylosinus sp. LW4]|uniref:hypothetical protein n=1 Tax=Methylosinus sp. LW4 TaxID=136993 RepID=UPI000382C19B|nr:hypothetical protein [Methylosinus sp. LW4]